MLRHLKGQKNISSPKLTAAWIDQAHTYYTDSVHSDWRSAGLLYYYSFLNLAKALLVAKRKFSYKVLDTTATHHGLAANLQDIRDLIDYELQVYPPKSGRSKNVFSSFYEVACGAKWPYEDKITLKLYDILGYCNDIAAECKKLFNIDNRVVPVQSLHREVEKNMWFEMAIPEPQADIVRLQLANWDLQSFDLRKFDLHDSEDWLNSLHKNYQELFYYTIMRSSQMAFDDENRLQVLESLWKDVRKRLEPYIVPPVYEDNLSPVWHFIPNIDLAGKSIRWHPVFSNYLTSFALSTILRYQPQLLKIGTPNYFISQAWCSQSARTTLAYFLMLFTDPPLYLQTI